MYKCCLCGKEYETEKAAVKCVNKCSREKFLDGAFQHKEAKYSGERTTVSFLFKKELGFNTKEEALAMLRRIKESLNEGEKNF